MRGNAVKTKALRGEPVFGTFGWEFLVSGLPMMVKATGGEFLLIDMEHNGAHYDMLKTQCALCQGLDLVPLARVPAIEYTYIARALDAGAMGIMAPMVRTAEEARFLVSCTRYPPTGRRGAAFGFAHDEYESISVAEKIRIANERTMVICLIETPEAIENIDEIAAVPGVDVLWLGHFDLTNFMGIPAQFDHPDYVRAIDRMVAAARKHNKVLASMTGSDEWSRAYWQKGFRMFAAGVDAHLLQSALRSSLATLKQLAGG